MTNPVRLPWWRRLKFKRIPVAWLTFAVTTGYGALGLAISQHEISDRAASWISFALGAVAAALGVSAHKASTPLAAPRDREGTPLVRPDGSPPAQ